MKNRQRMQKTHIMKFIEITALLLALLIVETVIGIAIYRHAAEVAYNGQMNDYLRCITRLAKSVDGAIESGKTQEPDMEGTLSGTVLRLFDHDYTADTNIAKNLGERNVNIYRLSEVCPNQSADERILSDETVYVIYSEPQEDGTLKLSFRSLAGLTENVSFEIFGGITVFSGSGRSEYVCRTKNEENGETEQETDAEPTNQLEKYRLSLSKTSESSAQTVQTDRTVYALSVAPLAAAPTYTVGGYADFSGGQKELNGLKVQIILSMVCIGLFTAIVIYAGAYAFGGKNEKKAYFFTVNAAGIVIYRNKKFAEDFPDIREVTERLNRFDENRIYTLCLTQDKTKLMSCFVRKHFDGTIDVIGRELTVPVGNDIEMERKDNMSSMFRALSGEHPKVLVGMIYFHNLSEIKDVFGREFAESVRNLLLERVRKQFAEMFVFDYYTLGVLQQDGTRLEIMMRDMEHVVSELNRVVKVGENNVLVNVKCGFALSDRAVKEISYDDVTAAANAALKRACEPQPDVLNRVDYYLFLESQRKFYARYLFKIDIPQMLKNGDFYLEYQPQYSLSKDRIVGFEALFRVNRRVQINVSTLDIINYAEQSGNMVLLGIFILTTGMKFAKSIEGMGVRVSLNVSPVQLMQTGFVDNFLKIYHSFDLKPGSISVEITESYLVSDISETLKKLNVLCSNGIDIHLDDFGTGYSSFNYLSVLPISTIKIDQSFVRDITENHVNRLITKTIVEICQNLNLDNICEGIEKPDQLEQVQELGCDIIQGYVISRSVNEETARDMIVNYHYLPPAAEAETEDVKASDTK